MMEERTCCTNLHRQSSTKTGIGHPFICYEMDDNNRLKDVFWSTQ